MKIENVLMNCDDCGLKNQFNYMLTTENNYSVTLCYDCLGKLNKQINEHVEED